MPRLPSKRLMENIHRHTEEYFYGDRAIYYEPASSTSNLDDAGQPQVVTQGTELPCAFSDNIRNRQSLESWLQEGDLEQVDSEVRLAEGIITPSKGGRFKLIQKWDNPNFVESEYEVIGVRYRAVLGYMCALKRASI